MIVGRTLNIGGSRGGNRISDGRVSDARNKSIPENKGSWSTLPFHGERTIVLFYSFCYFIWQIFTDHLPCLRTNNLCPSVIRNFTDLCPWEGSLTIVVCCYSQESPWTTRLHLIVYANGMTRDGSLSCQKNQPCD